MAARIVLVIVALGAVFGLYWVTLPLLRAAMLPTADGALLWVVGPPRALRFGACAVLSALTLPLLLRPLGRRWREADVRAGRVPASPTSPTHMATLIRGALLFVIYAVCGAFYFTSYAEVADHTITFHSPLGARRYAYGQIRRLEHQPAVGGQDDRYAIAFDDDRWGYFDASCEGLDAARVAAIAGHVSDRAHLPWTPGAR